MSKNANPLKGPALWTLLAGVAIGAGSMYSVFSGKGGSVAFAQPQALHRPAAITETESLAALKALDSGFASLAEYASPAVVLIRSESKGTPSLNGMAQMPRRGEGSGVIFRPDGYIVTNDHVVGGFDNVTVVLKDGRELPGKVTRAEESDIAVVKIEAKELPTLPFADSSKVKPGQFAMAIGAPYGLENTVTIGHVSALNRQNGITDPMTGKTRFYPELIQTDASINMGNSGGPLINTNGEVIGINSSIVSPTGSGIGLGFAITSNQARMLAETLIEKGKVVRAYMGVGPVDLKEYQKKELKLAGGALIEEVRSDGPAAAAGVKVKDVVVRVGDVPVEDQLDLRNAMLKYSPGTTVPLEVVRDGQRKTFQVKLSTPPQELASTPRSVGESPFGNGTPEELKEFMKEFGDKVQKPRSESAPEPRPFNKVQLGVQLHDIDSNNRKQFNIPENTAGAVVQSILPGSVAEKIGLKPGDVLQAIGDTKINDSTDARTAMQKVEWGKRVGVSWVRFNKTGVERFSVDAEF